MIEGMKQEGQWETAQRCCIPFGRNPYRGLCDKAGRKSQLAVEFDLNATRIPSGIDDRREWTTR